MITKQQYRRLMNQHQETGNATKSALQADVSRTTAQKYIQAGQPPAELQIKHTWRTRKDPLAEVWPKAEALLREAPDLEAKTLFHHLWECEPWQVQEKHLRTFQRRVQLWRLENGPDKEVFFAQDREPGRAMQLDWTNANELAVTVGGEKYDHLLCHAVLPYSNWQWAIRCQSESLLSLRQGLQEALHLLGRAPQELQTDNTSAATHRIGQGEPGRDFNPEYQSLCDHYGLKPRTIQVGCANENGDVESLNGHLKRRLNQRLLLRGHRDFEHEVDYEAFLEGVLQKANRHRKEKVEQELAVMRDLPETRLSEYDEVYCRVGSGSTIRVKKVGYSVPARLIGQEVKVEVYESQLKIYSGRQLLLSLPRHKGDRGMVLDYRHVIEHLLRKPGAFERYRYREQMYPSRILREACDRLITLHGQRRGTLEYLRLLKLASEVPQGDLEMLLIEYVGPNVRAWTAAELRQVLQPTQCVAVPMPELLPDCHSYDALLSFNPEVTHVS